MNESRVLEKLDKYLKENDRESAERLLEYWLNEAEDTGDIRLKLTLLNEKIGFLRKSLREEECYLAIEEALSLVSSSDFSDTVSGATTFLNAGTGYKAFGIPEAAALMYEKALVIYERDLKPDDMRFAGLFNNLAMTYAELGRAVDAETLLIRAKDILIKNDSPEKEMNVTDLNLADIRGHIKE